LPQHLHQPRAVRHVFVIAGHAARRADGYGERNRSFAGTRRNGGSGDEVDSHGERVTLPGGALNDQVGGGGATSRLVPSYPPGGVSPVWLIAGELAEGSPELDNNWLLRGVTFRVEAAMAPPHDMRERGALQRRATGSLFLL
jgi:hypothetical protein